MDEKPTHQGQHPTIQVRPGDEPMTPLTLGKSMTLMQLKEVWSQRYAALTLRQKIIGLVFVLVLWTGNACTFFGLNFWLWSFKEGNSNYVSIWLPALIWAFAYFIPVTIYKLVTSCRSATSSSSSSTPPPDAPKRVPGTEHLEYGSWCSVLSQKKVIGLLILIGLLDSLGGLTSVYSAKATPIFLQTMMYATGPIWTFFLTKVFFPQRARPFTIYPAVAFTLILIGIGISSAHQFSHIEIGSPYNIFFILIYLSGIIIPCIYGILSGRFLHDYQPVLGTRPQTTMMILCGDTISQLVFTTAYFPLDALPWFGSSPTIQDSWNGAMKALTCVRECPENAIYMCLYCGGFWVVHVLGVVMNHYSPTLYAVVSLLNGPIYVFLLIAFPVLRVNGAPGVWYLEVICFVCLLSACLLFIVWEESVRFLSNAVDEEEGAGEAHYPVDSIVVAASGGDGNPEKSHLLA